ncbi:MAG: hypothetical protein AB2L20_01035 [Mangrovibacterium sp.]
MKFKLSEKQLCCLLDMHTYEEIETALKVLETIIDEPKYEVQFSEIRESLVCGSVIPPKNREPEYTSFSDAFIRLRRSGLG